MQRTKRQKKTITISSKLALTAAVTLLLSFLLLMGYVAYRTANSLKVGQASKEKALIEMRLGELENYYITLKSYSISIRNDTKFMQLISTTDRTFEGKEYIKTLLRNIYYSRADIQSFQVYLLREGKNYTFEAGNADVKIKDNPSDDQIPGYAETLLNDGFLNISPSACKDCLFTVTRTIVDTRTKEPLAVVVLEVDNSFFKAVAQDDTRVLALLDSANRIYYSTEPSVINAANVLYLSPYLAGQTSAAGVESQIKNDYYLLAYNTSELTGWRLVSLESEDTILQTVVADCMGFAVIALLLVLLGGLLFSVYTRRLTKPVYALANVMGDVAQGKAVVLETTKGGAEEELLYERFAAIADRITALQEQNNDILQQDQTLRMEALETAVNPYFLCHVLQSIQLAAMRNGQEEIQTMTQTLYSMVEYAMNAEEQMTIAREVEYAKEYLFLERIRINGGLDYRITTDKQVNGLKVPKVLLQPMVENALMRALENRCDSLFIDIKVMLDGSTLAIMLQDNAGVSTVQLEEIKRQTGQLQQMSEQGITGTSLANLAARIQLLYGENACFRSFRTEEELLCLTLSIQQDEEV